MLISTTLYEKNFRDILEEKNWFFNIESQIIDKKLFIVNNINTESMDEFRILENRFSSKAVFIWSDDIYDAATKKFNCDLHPSEMSYWYSIQYLCQLYWASINGYEYVINVGADCKIPYMNIDEYLKDSIELLIENESVILTTIPWTEGDPTQTGEHEQNIYDIKERHIKFHYSKVVSDQVFVMSVERMLQSDLNIKKNLHPFPGYGGDSFEKRLGNHLIENNKLRAIYKKYHYTHKSY